MVLICIDKVKLHSYICTYVEVTFRGSKAWRLGAHHSGKLRKPPLTANQMSTFCSVFHVSMRGVGEELPPVVGF